MSGEAGSSTRKRQQQAGNTAAAADKPATSQQKKAKDTAADKPAAKAGLSYADIQQQARECAKKRREDAARQRMRQVYEGSAKEAEQLRTSAAYNARQQQRERDRSQSRLPPGQ